MTDTTQSPRSKQIPGGSVDDPGASALQEGEFGLDVSGKLPRIHGNMYKGLYQGDIITYDVDLIRNLSTFNPDDKDEHCPDDVAAFRGLAHIFMEAGGAGVAARKMGGARAAPRVVEPVPYG